MDMLLVLAVGLVAGTISGIVGFGSSIMLMPVLVVLRLEPSRFRLMMDALLLIAGIALLWSALA